MLAGRGRTKIRAPRKGLYGSSDAVDYDQSWAVLQSSLTEIHSKNASLLSFEELYRHAYKLVLKKHGERLYTSVKDFERSWLLQTVRPKIGAALNTSLLLSSLVDGAAVKTPSNESRVLGEALMLTLRDAWRDHIVCMNMITDVLMYLERVYCKDNKKPSIFSASMALFRDCILLQPLDANGGRSHSAIEALVLVMLDHIQADRNGEMIDKSLLRSCVYMIEALYEDEDEHETAKLYLTKFEPHFLTASREYYKLEGARLIRQVDASSFCRHALRRAAEEEDRCRSTLSLLTSTEIKKVVETELMRNYLPEVIMLENSGLTSMIAQERFMDISLIYEISARVDDAQVDLKIAVQTRIQHLVGESNHRACTAVSAAADVPIKVAVPSAADNEPEKVDQEPADGASKTATEKPVNVQTTAAIRWVEEILALRHKFDLILQKSFNNDTILQTAITKSFTDKINELDRCTEYLSLFFDENMKKGIKGMTDTEIELLLDQGIILLSYIGDKDMFERYYKKHLSKRLLMKRSVSMDAERQMIAKMKMTVGNSFTQRIEKMFQDISTSAELSSDFKKQAAGLASTDSKPIELEINVLTSTMWPQESMSLAARDAASRINCTFPSEIEQIKQGFEKFYLDRHSGRKLAWQTNMGTADIRATFPDTKGTKKTRELNVSTYAMMILVLFNNVDNDEQGLSCEEIQARTNIPMHDLTRHLQSVSVANKMRILRKEPKGRDVNPSDRFFFNPSFYSPFSRIKVNVPAAANRVEGNEERNETEKKAEDERKGLIDAALVRIMKSRKETPHVQLVQELIQQVSSRFTPDVPLVKRRIESLIEREFLERVDQDPPAYRYLA